MTIAQQIGRAAVSFERAEHVEQFCRAARYLMLSKPGMPAELLARQAREPERVVDFLKAPTSPNSVSGDGSIAPHSLSSSFMASLIGVSLFDTIRGASVQVPPRSTVVAVSTTFTGGTVSELSAKPISKFVVGASDIDPTKVVCICAVSAELVRMGGSAALTLIQRELTNAVARSTDQQFLQLLGPVTSIPSAGSTSNAVKADLALLSQNVPSGATSRLFFFVPPAIAKAWSFFPEAGAAPFPNMTPQGGSISGVPVLVSDAVGSGEIWLCDATQIVTSTDNEIRIDQATSASLNMLDAPDSPQTASTVIYSLWQNNAVGVRAERFFAARLMRSAAAKITGAIYSGSSPS